MTPNVRNIQPPTVDGAALLDAVRSALRTYVVLPSDVAYAAVVLWTAATHAVGSFEHATRLAVHSAVKRSGKSRLLEVIEALAHSPVSTTNISVPALFRVIEAGGVRPPTLLLDEADRLFGSTKSDEENRELIGLLNNGFRKGAETWRCVGPQQIPTKFSNFAMAVVAGIGRKPDTIEDRAVNITMARRMPGESVAKYRLRTDKAALNDLRDRLAHWVTEHEADLGRPVTDLPTELTDRAEDAWEPLVAVADAAGGDWPKLARAAAVTLSAEAAEADARQSESIRLLADIREAFVGQDSELRDLSFVGTEALLTALRKNEDTPWGEREFTARALATRLSKFDVRPGRDTTGKQRGYRPADFRDPFARYLPSESSETSDTGPDLRKQSDGSKSSDGSTRQTPATRQEETAGQAASLTGLTGLTPPPTEMTTACGHPLNVRAANGVCALCLAAAVNDEARRAASDRAPCPRCHQPGWLNPDGSILCVTCEARSVVHP